MHAILPYTLVALDLETTGLSPEKDTIIEIAAIKFQLQKEGNTFLAINLEERSMLIDPGREIDEHISMITGISNAMVEGKEKWHDVKERVRIFIGENSIIIGHNVLFDVTMLEGHGISLKDHIILDTFELSEFFSGDAESLNLGFLAKKYGFDDGSEHRALDDTKLSLKLFLHYLGAISNMSEKLLTLWRFARKRDTSRTIDTLLCIFDDTTTEESWHHKILETYESKQPLPAKKEGVPHYEILSMSPSWEEEEDLIDSRVKKGKVFILTASKKQTQWLKKKLRSKYRVSYIREHRSYFSISMLRAWLQKETWKRKETILIIRLVHWLFETTTGSVDELKWYGEENAYKHLFSLTSDEETRFSNQDMKELEDAQIILTESHNQDCKKARLIENETLIMRDIGKLESALRFRESIRISFGQIRTDIDHLSTITLGEKEGLEYSLSIIEDIVSSVVARPSGPEISPPGDFGETYFFTQKDLWHRGYIWLIWAVEKLEVFLERFDGTKNNFSLIERAHFARMKEMFQALIRLARIGNKESNIILEIKENEITLTLIPRTLKREIQQLLKIQGGNTNLLTGYQINTPSITKFLDLECGIINHSVFKHTAERISKIVTTPCIQGDKVVILGTNLKSLRTLSVELKRHSPHYEIFTQGISGGKSKIHKLFERSSQAILLGLIDTWKDESDLWEITDTLNITKIPFDPPSDPYYLARTVGMANNFELYSIPMAIDTINTLIGRAKSARGDIEIYICDEKLTTMNWGRNILPEIL